MHCNEYCLKDFRLVSNKKDITVYLAGAKRCPFCDVVFYPDKPNVKHCDCCHTHLSDQPASHSARLALRELKRQIVKHSMAVDLKAAVGL